MKNRFMPLLIAYFCETGAGLVKDNAVFYCLPDLNLFQKLAVCI